MVVYLPGSEQTIPSLLRMVIKKEGEVWQAVTRINITRINITAIITNNNIYRCCNDLNHGNTRWGDHMCYFLKKKVLEKERERKKEEVWRMTTACF